MTLEVADTRRARLKGLLGRSNFEGLLLLIPCRDIHTYGMRRAIDVAFLAHDGTVLASYCNVAPRRRLKHCDAAATVERFSTDTPWLKPGDRFQHMKSKFHLK